MIIIINIIETRQLETVKIKKASLERKRGQIEGRLYYGFFSQRV